MSEVLFKYNGRRYQAKGSPTEPTITFGGIEISEPPEKLLEAARKALEDDVVILLVED